MVIFLQSNQPKPKSLSTQLLEGATEGALGGYQTYLGQKEKQEAKALLNQKKQAYEKLGLPAGIEPQLASVLLKDRLQQERTKELLGMNQQQPQTPVPGSRQQASDLLLDNVRQEAATRGETVPEWLDEFGVEPHQREDANNALNAYKKMSPEMKMALAQANPAAARVLQSAEEFNQRQDLQRKEFLFKTAQAKKKEELEKVRHEEELDLKSYANNADYREKILSGFEAYERDKAILGNMEQIAEKENLPTPLMSGLLEKTGLPIGILQNPDAEQFEKLSQELVKNITGTYGNRILLAEVQSFMKSIPTLMNSPEGKKKLIRQWKILNEGKRVYYDAYERIRERNPKRLPPDLHEQVLKESRADLDRLAEEFKNLSRPFTRKKVDPGTRITNDIVDNYLELSNNDPNIARKLAAEDGYEF